MLPALSALVYGLLDGPAPAKNYWKILMIYTLVVIAFKFLYQFPIFCGTPQFSIWTMQDGCLDAEIAPSILATRFDYVFGLYKFTGPASYPHDMGIFRGLIGDILVIVALLFHKGYLLATG